jgi:hypothetical protein
MPSMNISNILRSAVVPTGLPFLNYGQSGTNKDVLPVGSEFPDITELPQNSPIADLFRFPPYHWEERSRKGSPLWGKNLLGRPVFLPARLDGIEIQNPLISISGEKSIVETDIVGVGTVFEKVFTKPYQISILCSIFSLDNRWPEDEIIKMFEIWNKDSVLTLECALTDIYLQPKNNFILLYKDIYEMAGTENMQVIQFTGKSNIDFELEIS